MTDEKGAEQMIGIDNMPMRATEQGEEPMTHKVSVIEGVEGLAVYINDYRIAGPKPWGGGKIIYDGKAERRDIDAALERA